MNLEYKLTEFTDHVELKIHIENYIVNNLYFIILMQYDYFISFLITILSDINKQLHIKDIDFPIFNKTLLKDEFYLKLYHTEQENEGKFTLSDLKLYQKNKYINIFSNQEKLFFQNSKIDKIKNFQELLLLDKKKYLYRLLKFFFDKLFLKLLNTNYSYKITKIYNPFILILKEN